MSDSRSEQPLKQLLTEVIGSGPKSAEDLTSQQARCAFRYILNSNPTPTTLGAFLLANRWKRNTPSELGAFIDVMHEHSVESAIPAVEPVDCGANYDGKQETAVLGVGAGIVAAAGGAPVVVHSGDRIPTKRGCSYAHVLEELGVSTDIDPGASATMTTDIGFGFYYQPSFNPAVHSLLLHREQMGVRTFINTIETLGNPANASVHLGSFYHLAFAKKIIDAAAKSTALEFDRILMIQGLEGYDDIRPGYTKVAEWETGSLEDYELETATYGMDVSRDDLRVTDVPSASARITEEVVRNQRNDAFADAVVLNAAVRMYAGGSVTDIAEGVSLARKVIADGDAASVLTDLRAFNPSKSTPVT